MVVTQRTNILHAKPPQGARLARGRLGRRGLWAVAAVLAALSSGCASSAGGGAPSAPAGTPSAAGSDWVERTLASLSVREKVGQMLMPIVLADYTPEGSPGHDRIVRMIDSLAIGGLIVSVGTPT